MKLQCTILVLVVVCLCDRGEANGGGGDLRESPNNVHDSCTEFFMEGTTNSLIRHAIKSLI